MLWFGISLAVFFTVLSKKIILLMYGDQYIEAAGVLEILAWSTALICMTNLMTRTTRAANHQHFSARVVASSAVLNVVLNLLLIPKYRHMGAAWATLLTEANTFAFHIVFVSRAIVKSRILARIPKVAAINAVMAACLVLLKTRSLWMAALAALVVHVAMVALTRYFSSEELSFFTGLFRSKSRNPERDIQSRQNKHR
jgi:O-antigen/teichoic acid export membrane protein